MLHCLSPDLKNVPASAVADLRACGIGDEEILTAYQFQENQRRAGARSSAPRHLRPGTGHS
jgi:hypothetical protein